MGSQRVGHAWGTELSWTELSCVFLDGIWINCNQGVQGKTKDLVTEEWDDPGHMLLVCSVHSHCPAKDHENRNCDGDAHVGIIHELKATSKFRTWKVILIWISQGAQQNEQYHSIEDQVLGAQQDGASQDMAAQAAAGEVERHPGGHHLHHSGCQHSGMLGYCWLLGHSGSTLAPTPHPAHHPRELLAAVSDRPQQLIFEVFPYIPTFIGKQPWKCK